MRWAVLEHSGHRGVGSAEAAVDDVAVGGSFRRVHIVERPGDHGPVDDELGGRAEQDRSGRHPVHSLPAPVAEGDRGDAMVRATTSRI